ncbi:MAG: glycosyltransferase family 9 protein [Bacteroidales bacterium]|nr:glycosyltransferase family 9 protein [Bacteroidales bacterium]
MIQRLLVIRFSALGDIAMTVPVVASLCKQYPSLHVTMLTSKMGEKIYNTVLADMPNLTIRGINVKKDYKGIGGLNRLFKELKQEHFDAIADLHDVLRTKWLKVRFSLQLTPHASIDKGRADKKALIQHKRQDQLKSSIERYRDVFSAIGLPVEVDFEPKPLASDLILAGKRNIGIAPFAQHRGKIYPEPQMREVIDGLLKLDEGTHIYLFGGPDEQSKLDEWVQSCPQRIHNTAGRQMLGDDLRLMSKLDCMVSMDSANMHMASLVGCHVVSIWGATDVRAGFYGYRQSPDDIVSLPLPCRPCSVYGNKPCRFGDFRCMTGITPQLVVDRIVQKFPDAQPKD